MFIVGIRSLEVNEKTIPVRVVENIVAKHNKSLKTFTSPLKQAFCRLMKNLTLDVFKSTNVTWTDGKLII